MKKRIIIVLLILFIAIVGILFISSQKTEKTLTDKEVVIKQIKVEKQTIAKEHTNSLEATSGLTEKVELHATYYFSELLVEKGTYIEEGTNILKYTNGTYLKAPYDCVLISSSLPKKDEICKNSNYVELSTIETLSTTIEVNQENLNYLFLRKGSRNYYKCF